MKEKGFTLIEILAVIIVIAIISLITIPIIVNTIEKAKKNALVDSAYGILKAGNLYYMEEMSKKEETERYDFKVSDGKFVLEKDNTKTLKFTGKVPKTGILQIHPNGKEAIGICSDTYCACKSTSELKVTLKDTTCNINSDTGEIEKEDNVSNQKLKELEDKIIALEKNTVLVGTIVSYMKKEVPEGYLACDGKTYNIKDYQALANQIKKDFGSYNYFGGNGTTTFAVPDLRGEFLRGTGTNSRTNQGSGTTVGVHQDATVHNAVLSAPASKEITVYTNSLNHEFVKNQDTMTNQSTQALIASAYVNTDSWTKNETQNYTSRPTNTSVLYAIKY